MNNTITSSKDFFSKNIPVASLATSSALVFATVYLIKKGRSNAKTKIHDIPSAVPMIFQSLGIELLYFILNGFTLRKFFGHSRKKLNTNIFKIPSLFSAGLPGEVIAVVHPADQEKIYKKEKMLQFKPALPESIHQIHGIESMQNLPVGNTHSAIRKIYSSILSPRALESFIPYVISHFDQMWKDLESKSQDFEKDGGSKCLPHFRTVVRGCQLKLMCQILFGFTYNTEDDEKKFAQFCDDFDLCEAALFADTKPKVLKKGKEASERITQVLLDRFDQIYMDRLELFRNGGANEDAVQKREKSSVGNAMIIIADALIKDSLKDANNANSEIVKSKLFDIARKNLYLLLEASHGTTMHITTAMMYFLNHPDNSNALKSVRNELSQLKSNDHQSITPDYEFFKTKMTFADACINETMRLAPISGGIALHTPTNNTIQVNEHTIEGPVTFMFYNSHWYDDPETFPQPEKFLPQRWIAGDDNEVSAFAKSTFKPFGDGRHICLGMHLARLVMKVNLYCFARNDDRKLTYDFDKAKIVDVIFPEKKVSDDFFVRVHSD